MINAWLPRLALTCLIGTVGLGAAEPETRDPAAPLFRALGGRLAWVSADEIELVGDAWAELPLTPFRGGRFFLGMDARTTIVDSEGFTFLLRDVDYAVDFGFKRRAAWLGGGPIGVFLGTRGKELVDADGTFLVTYLGASLQSAAFGQAVTTAHDRPLQWRIAGGPVVGENRISADAVIRGEAHWYPIGKRPAFGIDLRLDGLIEDGALDADLTAGPSFAFATGAGNAMRLFLHYQDSRNPLGIGESVWMAGFQLEESAYAPHIRGGTPGIDGSIALGPADRGRVSGRWMMRFLSPSFADAW